MPTYSELQWRQDALHRNRENRGRLASASTEFVTTGVGTVEFDEPVDFGITFVEKPRVHYGSEINTEDLRELLDIAETDPINLPNVSGSVVDWDLDENEHYVGAWCAVTITTADLADIVVTHHFDFVAVGTKVIPTDPTD